MLTYLWLLLSMLAQAAHHIPRGHVRRSSLEPLEDASSTTSSMVWPTDTGPAVLSDPVSSCKRVFLATKSSQDEDGKPEKRVPAELAYECLNSIPFNQSVAAALLESMKPYLEWQSTTSYIKDPPEKYAKNIQLPYDFWSTFNAVEANVAQGAYDSEYDFGWDLYQAFQQTHDGHFTYIPDVVGGLFQFGRTTALVSVSEDGKSLPVVYAYSDILKSHAGNSSFEPSRIVQIDGKDTTDFLLEWSDYGGHQDQDALWNNLFYSLAQASLGGAGTATGSFTGGGRGGLVYPGPRTTLKFANGTNVTNENFARVVVPMSHIQSGADMYKRFLRPDPDAYRNAWGKLEQDGDGNVDMRIPDYKRSIRPSYLHQVDSAIPSQRHTQTIPAVGYPTPIIRQKQNLNGGYFLEGPEFVDVAVLTVASFVMDPMAQRDFQKINSDFIAAALAANKTKLIIDSSSNGGGTILQGYDLFKQLFPSIDPYGASRLRAHETIDWLGRLHSAPINQSDTNSPKRVEEVFWSYRTDLDSNDKHFSSWEQKYGPHPQGPGNDTFTSLMRWDLNSSQVPEWSDGIWVSGYHGRSNVTSQPFQPQDTILVTDGYCASTCAIFSEFLRQEAGVRTVSLGGLPSFHPMQSVGGTKGTTALRWIDIFKDVHKAFLISNQTLRADLNQTAMAQYSLLPIAKSAGTMVNFRDGIRRNDDGQTPYQFFYEPAECRIFYTKQMVMDQSVVWRTVADTVWGQGNACIAGDNSFSAKQGNLTAESDARRHKMWSVRHDFDIEEAWKGLEVEADMDWSGGSGDCVMIH